VEVGKEEFDRLFAVSVKGSFFCCQEAAKRMAEGGRIINLSSSTSAIMLPGYAAYVATKGAIEQFSHVLAKELGLEKKFPVGPGSAKKLGYNGTEIDAMPISMEKAFCGAGRLLGLGDRTMANPTPSRYNRPVMTNNPT
jgi:NAD(P)-dependent dehydrogenase (short-subunit alcohol dehydrogenase family)